MMFRYTFVLANCLNSPVDSGRLQAKSKASKVANVSLPVWRQIVTPKVEQVTTCASKMVTPNHGYQISPPETLRRIQ